MKKKIKKKLAQNEQILHETYQAFLSEGGDEPVFLYCSPKAFEWIAPLCETHGKKKKMKYLYEDAEIVVDKAVTGFRFE
ncbi:hypothetical protein [Snodgrassella sp. CFCC 13594]|uniref:hypothetical protein n=1 Tax=Snodgrassella sp. CFCC 13594 TaxID=1775559 RepID=UPI00082AD081|nr:hypothetical protein [Snodgrassella sp. CFCC 13594]